MGANIMINGVACQNIGGEDSKSRKARQGVLSFRNDLYSLKESREFKQNEGMSGSPSSRRRAGKVDISHSLQDSLQCQKGMQPSEA